MNKQNDVSLRFKEAFEFLKKQQIVNSQADFARALDIIPQSLSAVFQGKREVTVEQLSKLFTKFRIDPCYIFSLNDTIKQIDDDGREYGREYGRESKKIAPEVMNFDEENREYQKTDVRAKYILCQREVEKLKIQIQTYQDALNRLGGTPDTGQQSA